MAKFASPLLGYNNNVRHKNRVFHIQTEDSGVNHPHVITHLFMDGGRILKSVKRSYAEHVGAAQMTEIVRQMMKEQHKAMFIALRDGQFDHMVDPAAAQARPKPVDAVPPTVPEPPSEESAPITVVEPRVPSIAPAAATVDAPLAAAVDAPLAVDAPPPLAADAPPLDAPLATPPLAPLAATVEALPDPLPQAELAAAFAASPPPAAPVLARAETRPRLVLAESDSQPPSDGAHASTELTLDLEVLERAALETDSVPLFRANDLPPPPKNLFAKEVGTGMYRAASADMPGDPRAEPPSSDDPSSPPPRHDSGPVPAGEGRYAPARPAAIFSGTPKPAPSIFSDDLLSDKSLDEVILSYLAEDLEPPRRK